jgi:hypothetical protein
MAVIAIKTIDLIDKVLKQDQGAKYRGYLGQIIMTAGDAFDTNEDPFRKHLGASLIGRKCTRELWLSWHWAIKKKFDGRMLRLFNRGHLEEPRFVAMLLAIGCEVWQHDQNDKQWRISDIFGHFGGSLDAVIRGIPELPNEAVLAEFKTHNDKSFAKLKQMGVKDAKPEHYVQMQIYMKKKNLRFAIYMAVNKNDDHIYAEIVAYVPEVAEHYIARAKRIITIHEAPGKLSDNPAYWECKQCDFHPLCHGKDVPARNCRTCVHSLPVTEVINGVGGQWFCNRDKVFLPTEKQFEGCNNYVLNPEIKAPL